MSRFLKITDDASLKAALEHKLNLHQRAAHQKRSLTEAELDEIMGIDAAAELYNSFGNGSVTGGQPDFDVDSLKKRDAAEAYAKALKSDRLRLKDESGRIITALEPNEPWPTAGAISPNDTLLSDIAFGRPNAALQQTNGLASGGVFLPQAQSALIIDLARNASVCQRLGARSVPFPEGADSLRIVSIVRDPAAQWRGEGEKVPLSDGEFGSIVVTPKFLSCLVGFSYEMFESGSNIEQVMRMMIAAAMAQSADLYALRGVNSGAGPTGLRNKAGVNLIDYDDLGTVTNPFAPFSRGVRNILDANYPGAVGSLGCAMSPVLLEAFDTLVDSTGQPLRPSPWFEQLNKVASNQIPANLNGDETEIYMGDFSQMAWFMRGGLMIEVLREGVIQNIATSEVEHNLIQEFKVVLRAHLRMDVAILRPSWFSILENHPTSL